MHSYNEKVNGRRSSWKTLLEFTTGCLVWIHVRSANRPVPYKRRRRPVLRLLSTACSVINYHVDSTASTPRGHMTPGRSECLFMSVHYVNLWARARWRGPVKQTAAGLPSAVHQSTDVCSPRISRYKQVLCTCLASRSHVFFGFQHLPGTR